MPKEIERKFLVINRDFLNKAKEQFEIEQAYLCMNPVMRVRIKGGKAFFTVKSPSVDGGLTRNEWEWQIAPGEAREMMSLSPWKIIRKRRYVIPHNNYTVEVDVFSSPRKGLILAEIESPDGRFPRKLPSWLGEEVTGREEYYNVYMAKYG